MDQDWRLVNQEGRGLPALGDGCASGRSGMICLGLKYVVYRDPQGYPIESENNVIRNVQEINELWQVCGISFQVDEFLVVSPSGHRLMYRTSDHRELNWIRREFDDRQTLLVVTTGPWDRSGSLGNSYANAWTSLPGEGVYGVVLERSVGGTANVIAHELGHYLSLDHSDDPRDLMHPLIYRSSATLTRAECEAARNAVQEFWVPMIRW